MNLLWRAGVARVVVDKRDNVVRIRGSDPDAVFRAREIMEYVVCDAHNYHTCARECVSVCVSVCVRVYLRCSIPSQCVAACFTGMRAIRLLF